MTLPWCPVIIVPGQEQGRTQVYCIDFNTFQVIFVMHYPILNHPFLPCVRTFLPSSLKSHQRMCTADNPMSKGKEQASYAARAGAKVSYPKLRGGGKAKQDKEAAEVEGEGEGPAREDIVKIITSSKVLDRPSLRAELLEIVNNFVKKHSVEE